jgi:hypothetical protein
LHERVPTQLSPLFHQPHGGRREPAVYDLSICDPDAGPELLIPNVKMRRIVVIEEHPHRDAKKIRDGRHIGDRLRNNTNILRPPIFGGKKRMRQFGKVDIPQEAFIAALKVDT